MSAESTALLSRLLFTVQTEESVVAAAHPAACDPPAALVSPPAAAAVAGGVLDLLHHAVGLDPGESYDTCWLHRLRECRYITPPTAVLDVEFAPLIPEPEPPPTSTSEVTAVGTGPIDVVVSWFRLDLDGTHSLNTGARNGFQTCMWSDGFLSDV